MRRPSGSRKSAVALLPTIVGSTLAAADNRGVAAADNRSGSRKFAVAPPGRHLYIPITPALTHIYGPPPPSHDGPPPPIHDGVVDGDGDHGKDGDGGGNGNGDTYIYIYIYICIYIYDMYIHILNLFIDGCGCRGVTRNSDDVLPGDWAVATASTPGPSAPRGSAGGGGGGGLASPDGHGIGGRAGGGLAIIDGHGVPDDILLAPLLAARRPALPPTVGGAPRPSFANMADMSRSGTGRQGFADMAAGGGRKREKRKIDNRFEPERCNGRITTLLVHVIVIAMLFNTELITSVTFPPPPSSSANINSQE